MELYQLKYFLYAAKYENISKAAQALRVSQPSISARWWLWKRSCRWSCSSARGNGSS